MGANTWAACAVQLCAMFGQYGPRYFTYADIGTAMDTFHQPVVCMYIPLAHNYISHQPQNVAFKIPKVDDHHK